MVNFQNSLIFCTYYIYCKCFHLPLSQGTSAIKQTSYLLCYYYTYIKYTSIHYQIYDGLIEGCCTIYDKIPKTKIDAHVSLMSFPGFDVGLVDKSKNKT